MSSKKIAFDRIEQARKTLFKSSAIVVNIAENGEGLKSIPLKQKAGEFSPSTEASYQKITGGCQGERRLIDMMKHLCF